MPRIELSPVQRGFFDSAKSNVQTALDTAGGMERQATQMQREADALLKRATETRADASTYMDDVMLKIGAEHGCKIPEGAELAVVDGIMVFTWGEAESAAPKAPPAPKESSADDADDHEAYDALHEKEPA